MKYYIIAGEASGDLHGSGLMKALRKTDREAEFRFWGGDMMLEAGGTLVRHITGTSYMGFWEVVRNSGSVIRNIRLCKKDILEFSPDALILIDYPGFNLRMARYASKRGIRVFWYISPKVWAWNRSRVKTIKKYVDHMITIFPFETGFYEKYGYGVDYVGNPLFDAIESMPYIDEGFDDFNRRNKLSGKPVIALFAGSRVQEVQKSLPLMLSVISSYPGYQFIIAGAPTISRKIYRKYAENDVPVLFGQSYSILRHASAAIVVSGTATLEAALMGTPLVVCYRGSLLSYHIAKRFIMVKYISLVNLIMDREVVRELIQDQFTAENLKHELDRLLFDNNYTGRMKDDMKTIGMMLGGAGATERAAKKIIGYLNQPAI